MTARTTHGSGGRWCVRYLSVSRTRATVEYRAVRLEKPEWVCDDAPIWEVYDADGEYLDSLRIDAFRSARELQSYLDDMSEREAMGRVEKGGRRRQPTD